MSDNKVGDNKVGDNKASDNKIGNNKIIKKKNCQKTPKSKQMVNFIALGFFTPKARLVFIKLRLAFVKIIIFHYFDLKHQIQIKMDALNFCNQYSPQSVDFEQFGPMVSDIQKMILAKTIYETHDSELLTIVKVFKT